MGKYTEQQTAARQFYADAPRPKSAREECEEGDEAEGRALDEWAEKLMRGGDVPRVYAQRCAAAVLEVLREKDLGVMAGAMGAGAAEGPGSVELAQLLEGVRMIGIKIYQAPKRGMEAGALILASGAKHEDFASARELAEAQSVSHELTANAVEDWQRLLGLKRTSGQKSDAARKTYKDTNGKLGRKAA